MPMIRLDTLELHYEYCYAVGAVSGPFSSVFVITQGTACVHVYYAACSNFVSRGPQLRLLKWPSAAQDDTDPQ